MAISGKPEDGIGGSSEGHHLLPTLPLCSRALHSSDIPEQTLEVACLGSRSENYP